MKIRIKNSLHLERLSPDIAYAVIGVDDIYYRVINDSDEPVLYGKDAFDVIDPHVPEHWIRRDYSDGEFYLNPPEFPKLVFSKIISTGSSMLSINIKNGAVVDNVRSQPTPSVS